MWRFAGWFVVAVALSGCDTSVSPTSPSTTVAGAPTLNAALERAIQDEYRAEAIYQGVLGDFGLVAPFTNVLGAEERHSTAVGHLFTARGLPVPPSATTAAAVPHFPTVTAACGAGVTAERENIAMYDELLLGDLPADVRQVFSNNRSASLANHLPAFQRCS